MSRYQVGETVLAIRDGDGTGLNIFGEGVYVGERLRPGATWPCPSEEYELISAVVTQEDDVPIEEHPFVGFYDAAVARQPDLPPKQDRDTMIAGLLAERERPVEDRVRDLWETSNHNPCIYLDSGDIVWGYQCWWGALAGANAKYPKHQIPRVLVPVPAGNGRWK